MHGKFRQWNNTHYGKKQTIDTQASMDESKDIIKWMILGTEEYIKCLYES